MKLDILETHDRYQHFMKNQMDAVAEGAEECIKRNPLSLALQKRSNYVYIFGHPRTHEDGVTKRLIWQPRLSKPKAQTNSYLFRAKSNSDSFEVCWILPPREMWSQFEEGKVTDSEIVRWSIHQFHNKRAELEKPFEDDVSEERFKAIMLEIARDLEDKASESKLVLPAF